MATDTLHHEGSVVHHEHHDATETKLFGFWVYLMSDLVIFGSLFATYAVLMKGTAGRLYWSRRSCCCSVVLLLAWACWR